MSERTEDKVPHKNGPVIDLRVWWATIIGICLIIAAGSIFVTRSYLKRMEYQAVNYRPPFLAKLERDIQLTNRDGKGVSLGMMRDKVYVVGYQYTDCPAGCLGMAGVMKSLWEEFQNEDRFFLVSISLNPTIDTPEKMDAWVKAKGVDTPKWWFLTGEEKKIRDYMVSQFKMLGVEKNKDTATIASDGEFLHDQRLVLVDELGNVRGYYNVMEQEGGTAEYERLKRDLKMVLDPSLKVSDFIKKN